MLSVELICLVLVYRLNSEQLDDPDLNSLEILAVKVSSSVAVRACVRGPEIVNPSRIAQSIEIHWFQIRSPITKKGALS